MESLSSFIGSFSHVAFSGSRHSASSAAASCRAFLPHISSYSGQVGVGCARGVDQLVRSSFSSAQVFRVEQPVSRSAFAIRSSRMVHWASDGLLLAFPASIAPERLTLSTRFRGYGSGTWGSIALALGLGIPTLVIIPTSLSSSDFPAHHAITSSFSYIGLAPCGGSVWMAH